MVNGMKTEANMKKEPHCSGPGLKMSLDRENAGKMKGTEWRG
jgi:hypothetical protein